MEYINILTLKPIPPQERVCRSCRQCFISLLKMNAEFYKTCNECRYHTRQQGQRHRDHIKKIRLNIDK